MFKKKSLFIPAMLGCVFFAAVAVTGCNDSAEKKEAPANTEAPAAKDTATTRPTKPGDAPVMDTAATRPTKPGS